MTPEQFIISVGITVGISILILIKIAEYSDRISR